MLGLCIPLNELRLCPRDPPLGPLAISVPLIAPRRSPLASSRGSPARRPTWGLAPSRRGRLRTPARNPSRQSKRCPFLPPANRTPQVITTCLGSPPARLCGRTECVPPRKLPLASSPGFPAGRPTWGLAPSRRGGLRTPARTH
jgi:hypothetical protein